MSERFARSCAGKKHYRSERKAEVAAKRSQRTYGVPLNAYPCDFCKGLWVVGNTYPWNAKNAREAREENDDRSDTPSPPAAEASRPGLHPTPTKSDHGVSED